jgi:allantoicase
MSEQLNLAARWLGASVVVASDESFGLKENLLVEAAAAFEPGHFDHRGEIVDGWETRRRRSGGHDWVIVRLGVSGVVSEIDVDTSFFTGNYPASCTVHALTADGFPSAEELIASADWREIVANTPLIGDGHNLLPVTDPARITHLRLAALPDGGIARLRVRGTVVPDPRLWVGRSLEVSAAELGARLLFSSDNFYTGASCLIRTDSPANMGDGWETRRRRGPGFDTVVLQLAAETDLQLLEIDTSHFKYNASGEARLFAASELPAAGAMGGESTVAEPWRPLLPLTRLQPDTRHQFLPVPGAAARYVRLDAFPDGGLARLRLHGRPTPAAIELARRRWDETQHR